LEGDQSTGYENWTVGKETGGDWQVGRTGEVRGRKQGGRLLRIAHKVGTGMAKAQLLAQEWGRKRFIQEEFKKGQTAKRTTGIRTQEHRIKGGEEMNEGGTTGRNPIKKKEGRKQKAHTLRTHGNYSKRCLKTHFKIEAIKKRNTEKPRFPPLIRTRGEKLGTVKSTRRINTDPDRPLPENRSKKKKYQKEGPEAGCLDQRKLHPHCQRRGEEV